MTNQNQNNAKADANAKPAPDKTEEQAGWHPGTRRIDFNKKAAK